MSNVVHKLLRPVKFEDKTYEMIPLDLDSLSGRDIKEAKKEFELANPQKVSFVLSADSDFAAYLAARASKLPVELFDYIPAPDYVVITQTVINFLLLSGFGEAEARIIQQAKDRVTTEQQAVTLTKE
jgi:hypothetical protein|nr:MAG TPA: tail assembly chaperone protein [Caudoviricetes sp.]